MKQKFHRGDRVHIGKMPSYMSHFPTHVDAIILHSYADMYGGKHDGGYAVYLLPDRGHRAWYEENQLSYTKGPHGRKLADKLDPYPPYEEQ